MNLVIGSVCSALWTRVVTFGAALTSLIRLVSMAVASLFGRTGTIRSRLTAALIAPRGLRLAFAVLRALKPNFIIRRQLIAAYANSGTVLVTRFDDVKDVLRRDRDFEVVYGPRMEQLTGGRNFFLGMQDTPDYTRDVSAMRLAVRRDDFTTLVRPFAYRCAAELVDRATNGRIDVPQDLTLRVPAQWLGEYFGTPGPSEQEIIEWGTVMFWYLFIDLNADAGLDARALAAAGRCRAYLDALIQERKAHPSKRDDVLNRCIALQAAGVPGMDDLGIRNNLLGLIVGALPTTSRAAVNALDQLLDRPNALAGARRAAQANDDALLARYVFEALRFNPVSPILYRRATRDTVIAGNTARAVKVSQSTMVVAGCLSAMFDRLRLSDPESFRIDRPADHYILWGDGLHTCFATHINPLLVPAILKPLIARKGLRRAPGQAGQIDTQGTPFPVHLHLEFDVT
jgi:cytochrome P450